MGRQVNFNIGIIGCGLIGYKRSRSLGLKGRLVACADINIEAATKCAEEYNIQAKSVNDLLLFWFNT